MKQIYKAVVSLLVLTTLLGAYCVSSDGDALVTGSFTATGNLTIEVNNTSPAFGNINAGEYKNVSLQVNNTGDVVADVTQAQAASDSGNLAVGTHGSLDTDEYAVRVKSAGGTDSWIDIGDDAYSEDGVIASDLTAGSGTQAYMLQVMISASLTYVSDENAFSADLDAAAAT